MGERADRLKALPPVSALERQSPKARARELEAEIEDARKRLDRSLAELDKRRHEATDWRLQMRRHPRVVAGVGLGALAIVSGLVAVALVSRRRERPRAKLRSLGQAEGRVWEQPRKLARPEPGVALKVLAAIATAVGTTLAKKYVEQLWTATRSRAVPAPPGTFSPQP